MWEMQWAQEGDDGNKYIGLSWIINSNIPQKVLASDCEQDRGWTYPF